MITRKKRAAASPEASRPANISFPDHSAPVNRVNSFRQLELYLPARSADEILSERLAEAVEAFNCAVGDPKLRVEMHAEILRLRERLSATSRR